MTRITTILLSIALALSLLLAFCGTAKAQTPTPTMLTDEQFIETVYHPATLLLYSTDAGGDLTFRCTATVFEKQAGTFSTTYRLATAAHCMSSKDTPAGFSLLPKAERTWFYVTTDDTDEKKFMKAKVVALGSSASGNDFAVVEIKTRMKLPVVPLGKDSTKLAGEAIVNVSAPLGTALQVLYGRITNPKINRPIEQGAISWTEGIMMQMPGINGGSSGSSIVCLNQRAICGFVVGTIGGSESVALPASRFREFYENSKRTYPNGESDNQ